MMKKVILFGMSLIPLFVSACGVYGPMHRWDGSEGYWCGFGYGYGGMFMGIVVLIVLAVVVYFIVQAFRAKNSAGAGQESPLDILKKRYAKGDISKEEYDRIKNDL